MADDEVIYREVQGHFYHINYRVAGEEETFVTVATTRPETLLGDTALCVHPDDRRYAHLIDRKIPIIADPYVDPEMGTGCLKIKNEKFVPKLAPL
ncbi:MAG: hypothetical protein AAF335_01165 [Bacteroidota bacterium]